MNQQAVLKLLEDHQAIITNSHVVYTSGKHGSTYINKDAIYLDPDAVSLLCKPIADYFASLNIQVVAAPAIGGVILSQWVTHHLNTHQNKSLAVYAEKIDSGQFVFRRGYDKLIHGKRTLIVEDILTTGGSVKAVVDAVRECGGEVVGVAAICNRGSVNKKSIGDPPELFTLVNVSFDAWDENECPLCANRVPINTDIGKGREFLLRKQ